jgi:hypothetical protein
MNPEAAGREAGIRYVRKEGRSVVVLRTVDHGESCVVEAEVFPASGGFPERPGPYTFTDERQAGTFVTEAVEALMYLGCEASDS